MRETAAMTRSGDNARALASGILREGFEGEPSLYASVIAHALASRIDCAVEDGTQSESPAQWLERTLRSVRLDTPTESMIRSSIAIAQTYYRKRPSTLGTLATLAQGIAAVLDDCEQSHSLRPAIDDELDATIAAFLVRLDDADPLSAEHSRAVSLWCRRIAAKLNLDEESCRFAGRSGMLHDVGKSRTPSEILNAPRKLTDPEWMVMRDHTVEGARLLANVERLRPFEIAARSHHERLDAKGYPDRLPAAELPIFVRIVTVADSFNAMIGRRPYRLPLSPAQAIEQLVRHRETQFDPTIVDAMIEVVE